MASIKLILIWSIPWPARPEGDVEQRFVEETIVYNDSWGKKRKLAARCGFTIQE